MADKFKKLDKEFQLTDSSVNCYGFRLLTSGYQQSEYEKNPIGYFMHERYSGVALKWTDFRTENDAVFAKPIINLNYYGAEKMISDISNGFLNAASVGHIIILAYTDDDAFKLPGQEGPTVTKWFNRECSIVDIPGNFNSLSLFDEKENPLNLADFSKSSNKLFDKMKQVFLSAEQLGKLNLKADTADAAAVDTALNNLVAEAAKVPQLVTDLGAANTKAQTAEAAKKVAEDALSALQKTTVEKEVEAILATALTDKKITVELQTKLKAQYANNPTDLKDLIAAFPAYKSITGAIGTGDKKAEDLAAKSWDELHKLGKLEALKAANLDAFKVKYKEETGKDYEG